MSGYQLMNGRVYRSNKERSSCKYERGPKVKLKTKLVRELVNLDDEHCNELLQQILDYKNKRNIPEFKDINPQDFFITKNKRC